MIFKKGELRLLWPFYLFYLIYGLSIMIMPFMVIYFRDLGFSFFQISLINAMFGAAIFLFEVPTGSLADNFSRKYSVILGFLITGLAVFFIPTFSNFLIILLLWIIAGLGITFISGAEESWVVDNLSAKKRNDLREGFFMKSQVIAGIGAIIAPLIGGILVKTHSIALLWQIFGVGFFSGSIILFFAKEFYRPENKGFKESIKESFIGSTKGFRFIKSNKNFFYLIMAGIFVELMLLGTDGWTPLIRDYGLQEHYLGTLFSGIALLSVLFVILSKFLSKYDVRKVFSTIIFFRGLLLFSVIFIYPPLFLVLGIIMLLESTIGKLYSPQLSNYMHNFIPTKIRATVISSRSMLFAMFGAIFSMLGGYLMDLFGPQKIIAAGAIFSLFAIYFMMKIKK